MSKVDKPGSLRSGQNPDPASDGARLARLMEYNIIASEPEREFDDIARLAADALGASMALLSIAEAGRHWFKARFGTTLSEVPRSESFCDYTMAQDDVFVVLDAAQDLRFAHYPLVAGGPKLRFYAGANLVAPDGHKLGTLCIIDSEPRTCVLDRELDAVRIIARIASDRLELRRHQIHIINEQERAQAAERDARFAHERLRQAIDMLPEAIAFMDAKERYVLWNRAYTDLYPDIAPLLAPGVSFEYILRRSIEGGDHPEAIGDPEQWLAWRMEQHRKPSGVIEQQFRDGRWMRHEQRQTSDGGTIGIRVDISDLKTREENFRLLFDGNPVPMWVYDQDTLQFMAVNDAAVRHYGHPRDRLLQMALPDLHAEADRADCARLAVSGDQNRVWNHLTASGGAIKAMSFAQVLRFQARPAVLAAIVDVTERIEAEKRVQFLAHHDVLTELANRGQFDDRLRELLSQPGEAPGSFAVCLLDVDNFKGINDTAGHSGGDFVLRAVARHLAGSVRACDMVARLGGDEFGVLLVGTAEETKLRTVAGRLLQLGSMTPDPALPPVAVSASLGIARFPNDGRDPGTLVKNADLALYQSKADGRNRYTLFGGEMRRRSNARLDLHNRFQQALRRGELVPYYQPVVDLGSGGLRGFESLVRWRTVDRGLLECSDFASVLEEHHLAAALGAFMLQAVTEDMCRWRDAGVGYQVIGLNMTAADLSAERSVADVLDTLKRKSLGPRSLLVETTENVVIGSPGDKVALALNELASAGVRVALDDFGTGYASLAHLKKIHVEVLKIDKSFVHGLGSEPADAAIVNAVIGLGANLGITTVAEGVETAEQASLLRAAGCDFGQGYFYGKPTTAERLPFVVRSIAKTEARRRGFEPGQRPQSVA